MTLVGPQFTPSTVINANFKRGAHIRRNSRQSIFNSIFMGWPTGVHIDGDSCHRNADSLWLEIQNTVIAASNKNLDSAGGAVWQVGNWFNNVTNNNTIYTANTSVMLTNPFDYTNPDFRPTGASPMLTGASFTNAKLGADFDQTPTFRGAFGATNWMDGWASFTADTNSYSDGIGPAIGSGINDLSNKVNSMEVYPNPAQNQTSVAFNLTTNAKVTCTVSDLSGKVLLTESKSMNVGRNEFSINTSMLNSGLYILKVGVGNSFNTTKPYEQIRHLSLNKSGDCQVVYDKTLSFAMFTTNKNGVSCLGQTSTLDIKKTPAEVELSTHNSILESDNSTWDKKTIHVKSLGKIKGIIDCAK